MEMTDQEFMADLLAKARAAQAEFDKGQGAEDWNVRKDEL